MKILLFSILCFISCSSFHSITCAKNKNSNKSKIAIKSNNNTDDSCYAFVYGNQFGYIDAISKFGSNVGHSYGGGDPRCDNRSCKEYFKFKDDVDWSKILIYSPANGTITKIEKEQLENSGYQIEIQDSDSNRLIRIFHVVPGIDFRVGVKVQKGQLFGHHIGDITYSDVAVMDFSDPKNEYYKSYTDYVCDDVFDYLKCSKSGGEGKEANQWMNMIIEPCDATRSDFDLIWGGRYGSDSK